jgi:hypothetical protein
MALETEPGAPNARGRLDFRGSRGLRLRLRRPRGDHPVRSSLGARPTVHQHRPGASTKTGHQAGMTYGRPSRFDLARFPSTCSTSCR